MKCARGKDAQCLAHYSSTYKFFLAFENALCPDYVTEKLFRYMDADFVIVARGGPGYEVKKTTSQRSHWSRFLFSSCKANDFKNSSRNGREIMLRISVMFQCKGTNTVVVGRSVKTEVLMIIIEFQRCSSRYFTISSLPREPSPTRTLKWPGHNHVQITCNTSSAYHVHHVVLRATWYVGTAHLLILTELKSHLFELYFIG